MLRAAADLVATHGIEGTSLASIGERAGASRALATYHFGSKGALLATLARRAQDQITSTRSLHSTTSSSHARTFPRSSTSD